LDDSRGPQLDRPKFSPDQLERVSIWGDLDPDGVRLLADQDSRVAQRSRTDRRTRALGVARRVLFGLASLWIFLVALGLMKDGARGLAPILGGSIESAWNAVGLGWLGALFVLSGSPIAASSLTLLNAGALSADQSYAMIVGSRLGASFVVLVIGALYALRGRASGRRAPISIGVLALTMTAIAYVPGGLIGFWILKVGLLDSVNLTPPPLFFDVTRSISGPAIALVEHVLPSGDALGAGLLFLVGLGLLLVSFRLVDELLPSLSSEADDGRARWYVGPWKMFGIGLLVALATLSVSVALSLLVPAVARGYLRREQIPPYIAGANITTLADTLVVGILTGNQVAPRVVLAVAIGVTCSTLVILAVAYRPVRRLVFSIQASVLANRRTLVAFVAILFACPLLLLFAR
jgi:sodium-dependent phosphate cotransporter